MNDRELAYQAEALDAWVGEPFSGAWQPRRDRVLIGVGPHFLLLVPRGPLARLHSVPRRPANPKRPFSFQGALRAHLRGRLISVEKDPKDRVVDLRFEFGQLHLRLTGRSGGLWLLDKEGVRAAFDGPAPERLRPLPEAPPSRNEPRYQPLADEDWDLAARRWFTTLEAKQGLKARRQRVGRELKVALQRAIRLHKRLEEDLDKSSQVDEVRRQADTLAAHLHQLPRGVDQVSLPDLMAPEHTVWIPLDPTRTLAANLQQLYSRARRLDRMGDRVLERLEDTERQQRVLREALSQIDQATHEELAALESKIPPRPGAPGVHADLPWATWVGPDGEQVWVGRNAKSNRRLTFQRAKGHDFWMHLRGRPGAHLVIPSGRDHPPPLPLLLAAAQIALIHGKVPEGQSADVQYTRVRNVRSIPGAADGRVRVDQERVLHVTRDPSALIGWSRTG